jgi:hypothetical protein
MKKTLLGFGLALTMVLPALPQDKERDRVENAGTVMKEILNAPRRHSAECSGQGRLRSDSAVGSQIRDWHWR